MCIVYKKCRCVEHTPSCIGYCGSFLNKQTFAKNMSLRCPICVESKVSPCQQPTSRAHGHTLRYHNPLSVSVTHGPLGVATHGSLGPGSGSSAARARPTALARPPPAVAPRDHSPGPRAASPNHECCMSDPSPAAAADDGSLGAERVVPRGGVVPRTRQSPPPPPPPPPLPLKRPRSRAGRAGDLAARDLSPAGMTWSGLGSGFGLGLGPGLGSRLGQGEGQREGEGEG